MLHHSAARLQTPRIIALLLTLSLFFSGCTLFTPSVPELTVVNDLPVISGTRNANQVTDALANYFSPIADGLTAANQEKRIASLVYQMEEKEETYLLHSYLLGKDASRFELPQITIPVRDEIVLPESVNPRVFSSAPFLSALLTLSNMEISVDLYRYGENIIFEELCNLLLEGFDQLSPQTGSLTIDMSGMENYQKALTLELSDINGILYSDSQYYVNFAILSQLLTNFMRTAEKNIFGRYSEAVTLQETKRTFTLIQDVVEELDQYGGEGMLSGWYGIMEEMDLEQDIILPGKTDENEINRLDLAKIFVNLYETYFSEIVFDYDAIILSDTDDADAVKAVEKFSFPCLPTFGVFSPDYPVKVCDLPNLIHAFLSGTYYEWLKDYPIDSDLVTYGQMITAVGTILAHYQDRSPYTGEVVTVNNARDYEWYCTQDGTGSYSNVNCMPAMTCMALKWYDPDFSGTPGELRELYPYIESGWFMAEVEKTLEKYEVPFALQDNGLDNMLEDLNRGNLILAQMSEASLDMEGHCFVIFGYRKFGESVEFMAYDPQKLPVRLTEGNLGDETLYFEKGYCTFIIERFSHYYVAVSEQPLG